MAAARKRDSDVLDLDQIASLLRVTTVDDFTSDLDASETYSIVYREAIRDGASEEEAEAKAQEAEQAELDEYVFKYMDAVVGAADKLFAEHGLVLDPVGEHRHPWEYRVEPEKDWEDAADRIRETINGVGYFHFNSLDEFLESGPWTAQEAVLEHLGWIKDWPAVYGEPSAQRIVERSMRY